MTARGPHPRWITYDELARRRQMSTEITGVPAPIGSQAERGCPDGGTCHHACLRQCFRVQSCGPLSGVYPDNEWPEDIRRTHASPLRAVLGAVHEALEEKYGPLLPGSIQRRVSEVAPGLRLEMHPKVMHALYTDPYGPPGWRTDELAKVFPVPLKITADVPEGTWRLVIITEEVLTGGEL